MKLLLIAVNAKYIHSNLAIYSLHANAREYRDNVYKKEYTINQNLDEIIADIYIEKPN